MSALLFITLLLLQGRGGTPPPPPTPRTAAPIDLTGDWVSVVTEDWRWRMVTPSKGDYSSIPLNDQGRRMADTWNPDKDRADGNECRPFGAAGVMRIPGRVRFTWENDTTLKLETDAGTQTRILYFGDSQPPSGEPTWQGYSVASWEFVGAPRGQPRGGGLKVVTTRMKPGYLRKNGVPYSENAVVTEYFDRHTDYGTEWFTVTTIVEDAKYLNQPFITSTHFKREPDRSKWHPTPCG
jgi:hypothetical protein